MRRFLLLLIYYLTGRGSVLKPNNKLTHISKSTNVNGKPVDTAPACKASMACVPPIQSSAAAIAPSTVAQNIRWGTGASILPPAVIESITNDPESDEVIKNTSTRTIAINDQIFESGSSSSI